MNFNIFQWRSLKTKVIVFTTVIFLISISSLAFYANQILHKDMEHVLGQQQFSTVSFIAEEVNAEFRTRVEALKIIAEKITLAMIRNPKILQTMLEDKPIYYSLFNNGVAIAGLDGTVIAEFPRLPGRLGANFKERDYIIGPLKEGKITFGRPVMSKLMHAPAFVIGVPIRDTKGNVIGVIGGVTDLRLPNFLDKVTESRYGKTGGYVLLIPKERLIVTATDKSRIMTTLPALGINPPLDRFLQGYEGSAVYVNPLGVEVLASAKGVPVPDWLIGAILPTEEAFAPIHDMLIQGQFAAVFLVLLLGGLLWWMLKRQLAPMFTTMKTMATLSDTKTPLAISRQDEIGELIGGFNRLLETLGKQEEELRESEASYRAVAQSANDAIVTVNSDGMIMGWNPSAERIFGYPEAEVLGQPISLIVPHQFRERHRDGLNRVQAGGESHLLGKTVELVALRKDGSEFPIELSLAQWETSDKHYYTGIIRDIIARKRAEEEMAIIAEIGRMVGSTLDINQVFERVDAEVRRLIPYDRLLVNRKVTPDGQFIAAYVSGIDNPMRRMGDLYPGQGSATGVAMNTRAGILIQPTDAEEIKDLYPNLYETFKTGLRSTMSVPLISMNEVIGSMNFRSKKLKAYTEQDLRLAEKIAAQIAGAISNAELFNDLSETQKSLRESEELFRLAYHTSPDAININRMSDGLYVDINEGFVRLTGYTREEVLGKTSQEIDLWCNPEDRRGLVHGLQEKGYYENLEANFRRKDGSITTALMSARVFALKGVPYILSITRDISERKRAEEEKTSLHDQLLQSQKMESVGRLAGGVAHDFNNMLGVIIGHAEIALNQVDPSQQIHADLQEIRKAAVRSSDLTRQLLAFARKQTIAPKVLDLNKTLANMLKMLQRLIGEEIDLKCQSAADLWLVKMDPSQIDQILANLCVNARDAISGIGKITIETSNMSIDEDYCASHAGSIPGEYVRLTLNDDGCGMDKETLSHLFEPFFTTKGIGKGTGLGLATVYGTVKQNNGFINVDSKPGQGTTFTIYLPRYLDKAEQVQPEVKQEPPLRGQETILLVEDEPALLDLSKLLLEGQGYPVLTAGTPGEAIRLAEDYAGEIHLLMTDVVMPEMNGRDLAEILLDRYPHLKVLFTSGYTADVIAPHGVLDVGVHFIQKPFSIKILATKVREALDQI